VCARRVSRPRTFTQDLRYNLQKIFTARVLSDHGARIFGKDAKTYTRRSHPVGRQSSSLTSGFWDCCEKKAFIWLVRLLIARECAPFNYIDPFAEIIWYQIFSFILDPAPVNGQFKTHLSGNLPRVTAHSRSP
jgi:hypothetical protein